MIDSINLTTSELHQIQVCLNKVDKIISNAKYRTNDNEPKPISPEDLHKVFRDQFGFGKLR